MFSKGHYSDSFFVLFCFVLFFNVFCPYEKFGMRTFENNDSLEHWQPSGQLPTYLPTSQHHAYLHWLPDWWESSKQYDLELQSSPPLRPSKSQVQEITLNDICPHCSWSPTPPSSMGWLPEVQPLWILSLFILRRWPNYFNLRFLITSDSWGCLVRDLMCLFETCWDQNNPQDLTLASHIKASNLASSLSVRPQHSASYSRVERTHAL